MEYRLCPLTPLAYWFVWTNQMRFNMLSCHQRHIICLAVFTRNENAISGIYLEM